MRKHFSLRKHCYGSVYIAQLNRFTATRRRCQKTVYCCRTQRREYKQGRVGAQHRVTLPREQSGRTSKRATILPPFLRNRCTCYETSLASRTFIRIKDRGSITLYRFRRSLQPRKSSLWLSRLRLSGSLLRSRVGSNNSLIKLLR